MRFLSVTVLFAAVALCSCSSKPRAPESDPFLSSNRELNSTVRILAVAPVLIPEGLEDPAPVIGIFASLIDEELSSRGFSVVRPQDYEKSWKAVVGDSGDFVDPKTGERDEAAMSRAMTLTLEKLGAEFQIKGVVFPSIVVVEAPFAAGSACWDGVEQRVETGDFMTRFLSGSQHGVVGALSLKISIRSPAGEALYQRQGGIEVLSTMAGRDFSAVPRKELFQNLERNRNAVEAAFKPLRK